MSESHCPRCDSRPWQHLVRGVLGQTTEKQTQARTGGTQPGRAAPSRTRCALPSKGPARISGALLALGPAGAMAGAHGLTPENSNSCTLSVFVHTSCSNRTPQTGAHEPQTRIAQSLRLEVRSGASMVTFWRGRLPVSDGIFSLRPHMGEGRGSSVGSLL